MPKTWPLIYLGAAVLMSFGADALWPHAQIWIAAASIAVALPFSLFGWNRFEILPPELRIVVGHGLATLAVSIFALVDHSHPRSPPVAYSLAFSAWLASALALSFTFVLRRFFAETVSQRRKERP